MGTLKGTFHLDDLRIRTAAPAPNTAVLEELAAAVPGDFALEQNRPNPFNSSTVIRFVLPASDRVELAVYNLAGQRVATLVKGAREAGVYAVRWDGRDTSGQALASGVSTREIKNVKPDSPGVSKSNVSRHWQQVGHKFVDEFRGRDLSSQNWVAMMLDGIRLSKD